MKKNEEQASASEQTTNIIYAPSLGIEKGMYLINYDDVKAVPDSLVVRLSLGEFIEWLRGYLVSRGARSSQFNSEIKLQKHNDTTTITLSQIAAENIECTIVEISNDELEIKASPVPTLWGGLPNVKHILDAERAQKAKIYYLMTAIQKDLKGKPPEIVNISLNISTLRQLIAKTFNIDELHNLCQDLNVRMEDLGEKTLEGNVRELIEFCRRHDRLDDLLTNLKRLRPKQNWDIIKKQTVGTFGLQNHGR